MKLSNAKGTRDFPPEQKIARNLVVDTLKSVFERYGFNPLETPLIERFDVLSSKYAGGDEILKETFTLTDQGERELGLRYDLTVPFCRFVGMRPTLKMPFKRYEIGTVFRDGPIKLGRYRQFWQCDADVVGCKKVTADAELIALASDVFKELKLKATIKINNRKIMNGVLDSAGITKNQKDAILSIDKLEKFGEKVVKDELSEKGFSDESIEKVLKSFNVEGDKIKELRKIITSDEGKEGLDEIEEIFTYLKNVGVKNAEFDVSLARGLGYYTGPVFEVYLNDSEIKSSVAGGGRYDLMISEFLESKQEYPATGISFGLDVIKDALKENNVKSVVKVFVIPIGTNEACMKIVKQLRDSGVETDVDLVGKGVSKNLAFANYYSIPYSIFVGEDELKQKKVKLRDMKTGEEEMISVEDVIKKVI